MNDLTVNEKNLKRRKFDYYKKGFLVLKRKQYQSIVIDDDIEIVVSGITPSHVMLAIKSPTKKVLRGEIVKNQPREKDESQ